MEGKSHPAELQGSNEPPLRGPSQRHNLEHPRLAGRIHRRMKGFEIEKKAWIRSLARVKNICIRGLFRDGARDGQS